MTRKKILHEAIITQIRKAVQSGKSKFQTAKELQIPYKQVLKYTTDIPTKRGLPIELRERIRQEVKAGKTKRRVSIELGISENTVLYYTKDICFTPFRKISIQDKKLELMKDLLRYGYAVDSKRYSNSEYIKLKKHFPTITKVKMYGRVIFFLEGKEDVAVSVFLKNIHKKIISYQKLKQVTKTFNADLSKKEKEAFLFKKRSNKCVKSHRGQRKVSLRENDDSFSFFYIRNNCNKILL